MAVIVNVSQYNSVPGIIGLDAVGHFPGPLIVASNVTVTGSASIEWNAAARYALVTVITVGGIIYADSAAIDSPPLAVGAGQAITETFPVIRRDSQAYLLLRENA